MRYSLGGTVVGHTTWALNGCSTLNELDAQNVWPHQIPKNYTCRKRTCLLPSVSLVMLQSLSISDKRRFLVVRSDTSSAGVSLPEGHIDNRNSGTLQKVQNRKADCFALLRRRITEFEWMSNTAREIEAATQPLCQSSWSSQLVTQPLWQSSWSSHSATQPLCQSGHSATQPLCQSGWSRHSATQPLRLSGWLLQPLWQSG